MSDGVWLDQIPFDPPLVGCVECGDPLQPLEVMVAVVGGNAVTPLCRQCFDAHRTPALDKAILSGTPGGNMQVKEYWMADAEYLTVAKARAEWLIGEDENANWWVPCHFRDTPRRDGWRQFHWYSPTDWLHYWNSRRRNQVGFLFGSPSDD